MSAISRRPLIVPLRPLLERIVARRGLELRPIPPHGLEPHVLAGLGAALPPRATFFDVGANIGQTAMFLANNYPSARVVAFEPVSTTFATLTRLTSDMANVECFRLGVSDVPGVLTMSATPDSQINRVVETAASDAVTERVACTTLDAFAAERGIADVFLIKTDTEGHDVAVLAGARRLLETSVRAVFCETGIRPDDDEHTPLVEVQELLGRSGFALRGLYEVGYDHRGANKLLNALFLR